MEQSPRAQRAARRDPQGSAVSSATEHSSSSNSASAGPSAAVKKRTKKAYSRGVPAHSPFALGIAAGLGEYAPLTVGHAPASGQLAPVAVGLAPADAQPAPVHAQPALADAQHAPADAQPAPVELSAAAAQPVAAAHAQPAPIELAAAAAQPVAPVELAAAAAQPVAAAHAQPALVPAEGAPAAVPNGAAFPFQGNAGGPVNLPGGGIVYLAGLNVGPDDIDDGNRGFIGGLLGGIFGGMVDCARIIVFVLKYPVIFLLASYLVLLAFGGVIDTATDSLGHVCTVFPGFYPCHLTFAADALSASFGNVGRKAPVDVRRIDFPGLMELQSRTLDQLLAHSSTGTQLAIGVKKAELAVKDLSVIVKSSNLTSKDVLARALEEFAQDAKVTGRDLQQLSAKLFSTVDRVLAYDEYALRTIATAQSKGQDARATATDMFQNGMTVLSTEVTRVIVEATTVASKLDTLEEKLYMIRMLCEQELVVTRDAVGDLLSELWTVIGGNRAKLQALAEQVEVLRNVDWYRSLSVAHVVATTETLLGVEAELSELRDKLAAPDFASDIIPLEVHLASIERSARRISAGKLKAREELGFNGDNERAYLPGAA